MVLERSRLGQAIASLPVGSYLIQEWEFYKEQWEVMQGSMMAFNFTKRELAILVLRQAWRDSTSTSRSMTAFVLTFTILWSIDAGLVHRFILPRKSKTHPLVLAAIASLMAILAWGVGIED